MNRKQLLESALSFTLAAVAVAWLVFHFQEPLLDALVPVFRAELKLLMPEFRIDHLDWQMDRHETVVALSATLTDYRVLLGHTLPPGVSVNASTLAAHAWVHPVLMLPLLMAWPGLSRKNKLILFLIGPALVVVAELFDIPFMLWGAVDDFLYWQLAPENVSESLGSNVQHVLDGGGRFALSLFLSLAAIALCKKMSRNKTGV